MGSETTLKLPVIDFNGLDLETKNPKWDEVKSQVHKTLVACGCFEALFDKVPLDLRKSLFVVLKELFDIPLQTKKQNVSKTRFHGYLGGQYPYAPLYESMGIDDPEVLKKIESLENTLWPEGYPSFSKTIQAFSEQLSELDQIVRKMILESLGVEKYLDEHMNSTSYLLRVMKYSAPQTEEAKPGLDSHRDKNIVTILHQNEVAGLEVETKNGKWITYQPSSPNSFVVLIGDSFHAWTNGRLHSAFHRVMMTGNEARYSAGLFSSPEGIIKAPEELVDEEHPPLFKPYDHAEFLEYCYSLEAPKPKFALKAYCGV